MDLEYQTRVASVVGQLLKETAGTYGLSLEEVLVVVRTELGPHVSHEQMVKAALAVLAVQSSKGRYFPKPA